MRPLAVVFLVFIFIACADSQKNAVTTGSVGNLKSDVDLQETSTGTESSKQGELMLSNDLSGQSLLNGSQKRLKIIKDKIKEITNFKGKRTLDNTLRIYNEMLRELSNAASNVHLVASTHPDKELRTKAQEIEQELDKFSTDLSLNKDVFAALESLETLKSDKVTKYFIQKELRDFRRAGVNKDEPTRVKIAAIQEELTVLVQDFQKNISEDVRKVEVEKWSDLRGLPKDYITSHKKNKDGKREITTDYPDYIPIMEYSSNMDLRKELYIKFKSRGFPKNEVILRKILAKRYSLARMLGYQNWAHYNIENKMMKSYVAAQNFINRVVYTAKKPARADYQALLKEKKRFEPAARIVHDYEKGYYLSTYKKHKFDFDPQKVREYFEFNRVKQGVFDITTKLFGVTYKKVTDVKLWHEDVEAWDIFDGEKHLGRFYLDLFPREGKYKHAAHFGLREGVLGKQLPQGVLVTNFPKPIPNEPALMEHGQVETFLHEFGHLLHNIFAGQHEWMGVSGLNVEWDFVEVPSQLLEEWIWDPATLRKFAIHYKTGKPIPDELIKKMRKSKEFGEGIFALQQMFYATLSLKLYNQKPSHVNVEKLSKELQNSISNFKYVPGTHFAYSFGHLMGYSASYYTYMWSLVISKDLFSEFERKGMYDQATARRYRQRILEKGGTMPAAEMVEDFLGRKFNYNAFEKWLNARSS